MKMWSLCVYSIIFQYPVNTPNARNIFAYRGQQTNMFHIKRSFLASQIKDSQGGVRSFNSLHNSKSDKR